MTRMVLHCVAVKTRTCYFEKLYIGQLRFFVYCDEIYFILIASKQKNLKWLKILPAQLYTQHTCTNFCTFRSYNNGYILVWPVSVDGALSFLCQNLSPTFVALFRELRKMAPPWQPPIIFNVLCFRCGTEKGNIPGVDQGQNLLRSAKLEKGHFLNNRHLLNTLTCLRSLIHQPNNDSKCLEVRFGRCRTSSRRWRCGRESWLFPE